MIGIDGLDTPVEPQQRAAAAAPCNDLWLSVATMVSIIEIGELLTSCYKRENYRC